MANYVFFLFARVKRRVNESLTKIELRVYFKMAEFSSLI